jgi:NADH:ubiquinone oxidoreductase subunit 4 (subunit M)
LVNRLLFGNVKVTYIQAFSDVIGREFVLFAVLAMATIWFGLAPYYIDSLFETSV